jgi:hypothetical protein
MAELTRRYVVMAMATQAPFDVTDPDGVFVLKPWKDPAALRALEAYRDHCYPELARDLDAWIRAISRGPAVRGDVGRRNDAYASDVTRASRRASSASPRRRVRGQRPTASRATRKRRR